MARSRHPTDEELRRNFERELASVTSGGGLRSETGLDVQTDAALMAIAVAYPAVSEELVRAARAHKAGQTAERDAAWSAAEAALRAALPDLLTGRAVDDLAQTYHELGRLLARRGEVEEATAHVERSRALIERSGDVAEQVAVLLTLGKLRVAASQPDEALAAIRRALELASAAKAPNLASAAADLIVRAHQIDARGVLTGDPSGRETVLARVERSREALARAGQTRSLAALDSVKRALSAD